MLARPYLGRRIDAAPMPEADVIVVGLGAMGSATAYHLARRGHDVVGFDRHHPPHAEGSSHGGSRIIREAHWEDPAYVPLVRRAYELWDELEEETGRTLLHETGGIYTGPPNDELVPGTLEAAAAHGTPCEELTPAEVRDRYPPLQPPDDWAAVSEPRSGALVPEDCVETHLDLAEKHGARLRLGEAVRDWTADDEGVRVETADGALEADLLVLTAGAWMPDLLADLDLPLQVERQVMHWFEAPSEDFALGRSPVFAFEYTYDQVFYGFPDLGNGVKVAIHHDGEEVDGPEEIDWSVRDRDVRRLRDLLEEYIPALDGEPIRSEVCMYTNTPDLDFVLDTHPDHPEVVLGSPCSGHGFKFASAVGETLADLAEGEDPAVDLSAFRLDRF